MSKDNELNNVFLVQLSDPTEFMLQRAIRYQKFRSRNFDVYYLFDVTDNYEIPEQYKRYFLRNVHTFNSSDYYSRYPNTKDLIEICPRIRTVRKGKEFRYIAYLSLVERVNEIYLEKKINTKYLWILEQDSAVTGNITKIMEDFDNINADFVSISYYLNSEKYNFHNYSKWKFSQCLSKIFKTFLEDKYVSISRLFFIRVSKRYMKYLDEFVQRGYHGNSELIYPTIASINNLSMAEFPKKYVFKGLHSGSRFKKEAYYSNLDREIFIHSFKE